MVNIASISSNGGNAIGGNGSNGDRYPPGAIAAQQAQMQAERLQTAMIGAEVLTERNRTLEQNLLQNSLQSQQQAQDILGAASQMMQQHEDTRMSWQQDVDESEGRIPGRSAARSTTVRAANRDGTIQDERVLCQSQRRGA